MMCKPVVTVFMALLALALLWGPGLAVADQKDSRLPELYERLKTADSAREARIIEQAIWQIWMEIDDDDAGFVFRRGLEAMANDEPDDAMRYFTETIKRAPDFAEGWNKRATVRFVMGDFQGSVEDVEHTLALEPQHFGALSGLGLINLALGREAAALRAFEAAAKVNPFFGGVRDRIKELRDKLGGKPT
jgi:tetratricopeptide (TPR) repeat protein